VSGPAGRGHLGLVLVTKAPTAGLAKRRLGGQIGPQAAAAVAGVLLDHTLTVCLDVGVPVHGVYSGARSALPHQPGVTWRPTRGDDPVAAVLAAFRDLAGAYERLVAVPSDVPGLSRDYLTAAAAALDRCEIVLGPSRDGGLVLLGTAGPLPDELRHVRASSGRLHDDVLACCADRGLAVECLPPLTDLDSCSSLATAVDEGELGAETELHARLITAMTATPPSGGGAADQLDDVRPGAARGGLAGERGDDRAREVVGHDRLPARHGRQRRRRQPCRGDVVDPDHGQV
jgi:hypothetical protein